MARKSKLLAALDAHRGRDVKQERQKRQEKMARKRAGVKIAPGKRAAPDGVDPGAAQEFPYVPEDSSTDTPMDSLQKPGVVAERAEIMDSAGKIGQPSSPVNKLRNDHSGGVDVEIGSSEVEEDLSQEEDGIPLSDIESMSEAEREDIVPHQRLTINNTTALLRSYKSISAPQTLPFSAHQTLFSPSHTEIPDVHDDLNRELAFYKQALDATLEARQLLTKEKSPFTRPGDYFAEMVKSDEHMDKIRAKMVEEAANKKAAAEARKQRDLKKFGKQVQIARLQERDRAKRETLDNINQLKRKRKGTNLGQTAEEDLFDVALENEGISKSRRRGQSGTATPRSSTNRQKKDEKFGYGGKKRFSKSGDALSAGDLSSFSAKRMKGQRASARRPGKSRRAKFS